mmetsp:Transcript_109856/g.310839  ORF Transcript_109856/g.310839 Transcript_109856/m.310839 type:complete len:239 (-) Transcript_109856:72-788(-)
MAAAASSGPVEATRPADGLQKDLHFPLLGSEAFVEHRVEYPDTPMGRWEAKRPQVAIADPDGNISMTGCIDDVVISKGADYPVLRQGGDKPVFSTAGFEALIADVAEKNVAHKSGMTPTEEKMKREYPEAYDEIRDMIASAGVLSPEEELAQVRKMRAIMDKWKEIYKERARTREATLKKALGERGYKNRKRTAARMGLGSKAYEEQVLRKVYAAENEAAKLGTLQTVKQASNAATNS